MFHGKLLRTFIWLIRFEWKWMILPQMSFGLVINKDEVLLVVLVNEFHTLSVRSQIWWECVTSMQTETGLLCVSWTWKCPFFTTTLQLQYHSLLRTKEVSGLLLWHMKNENEKPLCCVYILVQYKTLGWATNACRSATVIVSFVKELNCVSCFTE